MIRGLRLAVLYLAASLGANAAVAQDLSGYLTGEMRGLVIHDAPVAASGLPYLRVDETEGALADHAGKYVLLNFWATWCPPCRAEMPSLERAWQTLKPEGIGVIAINVGEESDVIDQFTMETEVSFPLPMDLESRVIHQWQVRGLPTTYVVDAEGRLAYVATGEREWDDPALLDLVRALKKETR